MGFFTNPEIDTRSMEHVAKSMQRIAGREAQRQRQLGAAGGGCLMTLLMLPALPVLALIRKQAKRR